MLATSKRLIHLTASADGAKLSNGKLNGLKYLIVPVISKLGNNVEWPINAESPEFIPGYVLEFATESRNNRPVVMDHPKNDDGEYCSANSPEVLEKYCYGFTFNARYEDGKVKSEMWLNEDRAKIVGKNAERVIERLKAGEMVEVSEGDLVVTEDEKGEHNGKEYGAKWLLCIGDHLATLSEGSIGACSVEDGCGAMRISKGFSNDNIGLRVATKINKDGKSINSKLETKMEKPEVKAEKAERKLFVSSEGVSDQDLREWLSTALHEIETGYDWLYVEAIYQTSVVYHIYSEDNKGVQGLYERSYILSGDTVTLVDDKVEVKRKRVEYEPLTTDNGVLKTSKKVIDNILSRIGNVLQTEIFKSSEDVKDGKNNKESDCSCKGESKMTEAEKLAAKNDLEKSKQSIDKLIASGLFTEEDRKPLSEMTVERLSALEEKLLTEKVESKPEKLENKPEVKSENKSEAKVEVSAEKIESKPKSVEEWLSDAPPEVRTIVSRSMKEESDKRTQLVNSLKVASAFSEDRLKQMPTDDLLSLAKSLKIDEPKTDFSAARVANSEGSKVRPTPDTWGIRAAKESKESKSQAAN